MAEPRRIALISAPLPVEKKSIPKSSADSEGVTTFSVGFIVSQPSETIGPVYDYEKLYALKKKEEKQYEEPKNDDPFGEEAEEAKAVKLAKHFEEKYGTSLPRDMKELGAGYDHNDPFVDDGQSVEAVIPPGWTTQHGGFYISTGPLYIRPFRSGEEKDHIYQSATNEECISAIRNITAQNIKRKRVVQSSEDENSEDSSDNVVIKRKRVTMVSPQPIESSVVPPVASENPGITVKKPVARTVASILAERVDPFQSSGDDDSVVEIEEAPTDLRKPKDANNVAGTNVSATKVVARKSDVKMETVESGSVAVASEEIPDSVRTVIDELRNLAVTWDGGKCNFFSPEYNPVINGLLLKLEWECRQFRCGLRSSIFGHVAGFLPCTKETLVKRARKLRQEDIDLKFGDLIARLGRAIQSDSSGGFDPVSKSPKSTIRKLILEGIRLKVNVYDLHKGRFATHEEYIRHIVDAELLPLWNNYPAVESQNVYCEALLALTQALRPPTHSVKSALPSSTAREDVEVTQKLSKSAMNLSSRGSAAASSKMSRPSSSPRNTTIDASISQVSSSAKGLYALKNEIRKDGMKQPSSSGSHRKSDSASKSSSKTDIAVYSVSPVKPVFLPDTKGPSYLKKSSSSLRADSGGHRSPITQSSSSKAQISPEIVARPTAHSSSSSRPSGNSSKSHRSSDPSSQSDSRHSSKSDRHSTHSPKISNHQSGEGPSSNSSAGSTKASRTSSSTPKNLTRSGDFDVSTGFSMPALNSAFVSPFNTASLPLMAGFSPENLSFLGAGAAFMPPFSDLPSYFSPTAVFGTGNQHYSRSNATSSPKTSSSNQSDSSFVPRKA